MRRLWDVLKLGKEGPEWERFRLREYLMDAEVDLRAVFDWYRRAPRPHRPTIPPRVRS